MDFRWWCVLDSISRKQEQICLFVVKKFLIYFQKVLFCPDNSVKNEIDHCFNAIDNACFQCWMISLYAFTRE